MIVALLILVPIAGVAIWAFFRFGPSNAERKTVLRFNLGALGVALLVAVVWCVRTYVVMSPTVDAAWWPVISALGALVLFPVVLAIAAVVRNFVIFRRREGPAS